MRRAASIALAAAALALGLVPAGAGAFYDNGFEALPGAFLVSADYARLEQGDDTTAFAAISANGRYVAIQTRARNFFADDDPDPPGQYRAGGIFRFDLQTRALEKVADGDLFNEADNSFIRHGASNPSINANGRYVAFSTDQQLVPADVNDDIDVYRRDMDIPLPAGGACTGATPPPCPFQLVSARNGSEEPASYEQVGTPVPGSNPGAEVSRGVSISADGQKVVFRTAAPSDLPQSAAVDTPAGQLFVRNVATQTTTLVTATREAGSGLMTTEPAGGALGAAISADGSAVAWTGGNAEMQTRFLHGEVTDPSFDYYLWRQAPFDAGDPTRRITGIADPDDAECKRLEEENPSMTTSFDQTSTGPCYGPLTDQESLRTSIATQVPALSGDGYTVAFLTGAGPRPNISTGAGLDLYITSMRPGLSRKEATTELTRDGVSSDPALAAPIESVAFSEDGNELAISTVRTSFTLPVLQLVGAQRAIADTRDVYLIDLPAHTIERVTHSYEGGDINGDVQPAVTLSADGERVAFTSFAGNLFFGDANQRPDAFVATRELEPTPEEPPKAPGEGQSSIEEFGGGPRISARLRSSRGGQAVLSVTVPAAGRLEAQATASIHKGKPREIAEGRGKATSKGPARVVLHLQPSLLAGLNREGKIRSRASIAFVPAIGGKRLTTSLPVTFFSKSSQLRHK
jgi:Tol biopolymer transport system component